MTLSSSCFLGNQPQPTFNIDFTKGSLTPNRGPTLTGTRASAKTYFDSTGTLQSATTNVFPQEYDPTTLAPLGLSVWEARTNSIRNNTMVGAVAGTPGTLPTNWTITPTTGLTSSVIGSGVEAGINYVDVRVNGTAGAASTTTIDFETTTGIAALTAQTWTASLYWSLVGGSLANITSSTLRLNERTSAGALVIQDASGALTPPAAAGLGTQRVSYTVTTSGGATVAAVQPRIAFAPTNGAAIDITLRIGMPQLELGAFATPVIATTTAAATRAADVISTTLLAPWFNANEGTFVARYRVDAVGTAAANQTVFYLSDGTTSNNMAFWKRANADVTARFQILKNGSANTASIIAGTFIAGACGVAAGYRTDDAAAALSGAIPVLDTGVDLPPITTLTLGAAVTGGATYLNGWLSSLSYYNRRLPNALLQRLSNP